MSVDEFRLAGVTVFFEQKEESFRGERLEQLFSVKILR
jgi:hypothetical protein